MQVKEAARMLYGLALGSLIYVPLALVPVIGPLAAGLSAGKAAKVRPPQGFLLGVGSAAVGFLLWVFLVFPFFNVRPDNLPLGIFWLLFALWNLFGAMVAGIGGVLGSMLSLSERVFSSRNGTNRGRAGKTGEEIPNESDAPVYVICPACATSNTEDAVHCINCGKEIR
jgi:hypothetical protein